MDLLDRAKETQFKHLLNAPSLQFSCSLIHEMFLRKIRKYGNEMHFLVNNRLCKFGIREFALITGLRFGKFPEIEETDKEDEGDEVQPPRLVREYLRNKKKVLMQELESSFISCRDKEDAWKLGLVYFVCQYLYAFEPTKQLDFKLFVMVDEDERKFLDYPWGKVAFRATLEGLNKDMKHYQGTYLQKKEIYDKTRKGVSGKKTQGPDVGYTVYGLAIAFQVWTYEVIGSFVPKFVKKMQQKEGADDIVPRILMYEGSKKNTSVEIAKALNNTKVYDMKASSETEEKFLNEISLDDFEGINQEEEEEEDAGNNRNVSETDEEEGEKKKETHDARKLASHFDRKLAEISNEVFQIKVDVQIMRANQQKIITMLDETKKEIVTRMSAFQSEVIYTLNHLSKTGS